MSRVDDALFLVGAERSGSTLLSHMLDHHPRITWSRGFEFAVSRLERRGAWPLLRDYHGFLEADRVFQTSGCSIDRSLGYVELVHDFLHQRRGRSGKPVVGATVHLHFERLPWLFPSARFIHLVRDGRDVSRSCVEMGWAGNVWTAAARWIAAEQTWDRLRRELRPEQYCEIRYESLIAHPEPILREICGFIGVGFDARMLHYPEDTAYLPPDPGRIEPWRRGLPAREIRLVEARLGSLLSARGYAASGLPPLRVGRVRRQWLREHDRYRRVRFRIGRNGLPLVAADFVARRVGLRHWGRRLQLRLNAIEVEHLK